MTAEELKERVDKVIQQEVYACQSSLVNDLIKGSYSRNDDLCKAFDLTEEENVVNMYPDPEDWNREKLERWLDDEGIDFDDERQGLQETIAEAIEQAEADGELLDDGDQLDELELDYCNELKGLILENCSVAEIYEWWLVSDWLARRLKDQGEVVLNNNYGTWWGRQCTGQAISMDPTIPDIVRSLWSD